MCVWVCAVPSSKCRSYDFHCDYLKANGPHLATNDINCSKWLLSLCECKCVMLLFAFEVMADLTDSEWVRAIFENPEIFKRIAKKILRMLLPKRKCNNCLLGEFSKIKRFPFDREKYKGKE